MTSQVSPTEEPAGPLASAAFAARGREADRPATGRQFTEPLRELAALVFLAGNAVLLFLGFTGLFVVLDGWASEFGARSSAAFPIFVGPISVGLPVVAVLLATHVAPMLPRYRLILLAACVEYGVSAFFGFTAFLGAFADDLPAARATLEGLLGRGVWLGFLALGALVLARIYVGLMPAGGRSGPGIPAPAASYRTGTAAPAFDEPTVDTGWPVVPPPPQPEPLVAPVDATVRVPQPPQNPPPDVPAAVPQVPPPAKAGPEAAGEATQVVPAPPAGAPAPSAPSPSAPNPSPAQSDQPVIDDPVEPPTRQFRTPS